MMILLLQLVEIAAFLVIAIRILSKLVKLQQRGMKMQQTRLAYYGTSIGLVGMLIAGSMSGSIKMQYGFSEKAQLIEALLFLVGFCIVIIGLQFMLASYKTKEETPHWIKHISNFWK